MFENYDDILTTKEVAEALKVGTSQIYKLVRSGNLKAFKEGKNWRIPRQSISQYVIQKSKLTL